ncbi:hypothetical protein [Sphingomonas sanguinis]|uniref:hypothetical protein n=1 Tax=Sphingomonas sanguinis TaxID=33051 RepID=UPI00128F7E1A|nr:hypothetical protein [Sphingomonas sanguinis]
MRLDELGHLGMRQPLDTARASRHIALAIRGAIVVIEERVDRRVSVIPLERLQVLQRVALAVDLQQRLALFQQGFGPQLAQRRLARFGRRSVRAHRLAVIALQLIEQVLHPLGADWIDLAPTNHVGDAAT